MRALLDTQIFVILAQQGVDGLNSRVRKLVEGEDTELLLSPVSIVEIATKATINKLSIKASDVQKGVEDLRVRMLPFEFRHSLRMFDLPLHHRDPFDRMLIAVALTESVPIVSSDREFSRYKGLRVIA